MKNQNSIIEKAKTTHQLSSDEVLALLENADGQAELFAAADEIRQKYVGDEVHLRGLIEFSNICKNNCLYCGIRKDNRQVKRYRLKEDEIIRLAENAVSYGFKTIVMQSGEDEYFTVNKMKHIIAAIKQMGVALTLSIGEKSFEEYKAYKDAGADRYLIRIETTDKDLYHKLDPDMSWEQRKSCLDYLKELGYEVGSGIMVGLPGQTMQSIANDLLFLKAIDIDMAGIGPFIPHPATPLKDEQGGSLNLSLRVMAIMRLLLPSINIPATTAMESLHPKGRILALKSGANVIMPNVSDTEYKSLYELYPGKIGVNDTAISSKTQIAHRIAEIGRTIGTDLGNSKNFKK